MRRRLVAVMLGLTCVSIGLAAEPGRPVRLPGPTSRTSAAALRPVPAVATAANYTQGETVAPGRATSGEYSLETLSGITLANHPALRESRAQAVAAQGKAYQAGLYPNPTFGTASPQLAGNQTQYNAYVIQDIVTRGKLCLDATAASRAADSAQLNAIQTRFAVLTSLRQRFYIALAAQERADILAEMVGVAKQSLEISRQLFRADLGTRGDDLLLEIELARAEAELQSAHTQMDVTRRQLAAATGLFELAIGGVTGDITQPLPSLEIRSVQQQVLDRNTQVRIAQLDTARSEVLLRRAQVEPFPNLNMMGGYQNQGPGANAPESQGIYQVQMVVPLWNRNQGNIRAAEASIVSAAARIDIVRADLALATAAAVGRLQTATHLTEKYEDHIIPDAEAVLKIYRQLFQQGQVDFLRSLAAQRDLLNANLAYVNAEEARWMAAAEVAGLLQNEQFP